MPSPAPLGVSMSKPTIWENLVKKLGRNPTNAECREECWRIMQEGINERAAKEGK